MTLTVPMKSSIQGKSHGHNECTWTFYEGGRTIECKIVIVKEEDGFSAHAVELPGVVSQGSSVEEAVEHITEALEAVLSEYRSRGSIPWAKQTIDGEIANEKRILVNA